MTIMKCLFVFCLISVFGSLQAQQVFPTINSIDQDGRVQLNEAVVLDTRIFANDTLRYHYNQTKHYVKMVMPYANAAVKMFSEIETASSGMNKRAKRKYIRTREDEIKINFEDQLKKLNITQGRLLIKIINRQLRKNCYSIVRELKNPITAAYYQSWARLNGIDLNENYNAEKERDLEMIMRSLGY